MATLDPKNVAAAKDVLKRHPHVNDMCIGCGSCVGIAGDVFEMGDEGYSTVKPLTNYEGRSVDDAIRACPVGAISWQEEK